MLSAKELFSKNIVVLVHKALFPEAEAAEVIPFPADNAKTQCTNTLRIRLVSAYGSALQVIAIRMRTTDAPMHSPEHSQQMFDAIEACLAEDPEGALVVAGDFDCDICVRESRSAMLSDQRPRLESLLNDSEPLWNIPMVSGTTSKTRTAFQTDISKMGMRKLLMKDFMLVSGNLQLAKGQLQGLTTQHRQLPDEECPSDHAPLTWKVEPDNNTRA